MSTDAEKLAKIDVFCDEAERMGVHPTYVSYLRRILAEPDPVEDDLEPLKKRIRDVIATSHDLARPFAETLPWNLGNVVIALAHNDLEGAQAALSAEFARRYGLLDPEGGPDVEVDEARA